MEVKSYNPTSKATATVKLPDAIFNVKVNETLIAQAIRVYLSNQRQGTKGVKTRADVTYSTRKLWRQKGTGRARHGSRKAPIFVGGGVSHGPTGVENYHLKMSRTMKQVALRGVLTLKAQEKNMIVLDQLDKVDGKAKSFSSLLSSITSYPQSSILLILDSPQAKVLQSISNLPKVNATQASRLNPYEVMNHNLCLITQAAVDLLSERLSPKRQSAVPVKSETAPTKKAAVKTTKPKAKPKATKV